MFEVDFDSNFEKYLKKGEAAVHFKVSESTIERWIRAGKLKTIRYGIKKRRVYVVINNLDTPR